jgi:adenylate cyclase
MRLLGLRNKLLLYSVVLAIVPLAIAGRSMIQMSRDELKSTANDEIARTAESLVREIDGMYEDTWVAPLELVASAIDSPTLGGQEKLSLLRAGLATLPDVVACQVSVLGVAGPVVVTRDDATEAMLEVGLDPAEVLTVPPEQVVALLERSNGGVVAEGPRHVAASGHWLLTVAVPLDNPVAGRQAVMLATVDLERIAELIADHPFTAAGRIELVDSEGRRLFDPERTDLEHLDIVAEAVELLGSRSRAVGARSYTRQDGSSYLAAYGFPTELDWALVVERREADAYRAVARMSRSLGMLVLAGLGVAVLGAVFMAVRISRPVEQVADVARAVGNGDLEVTADEPRRSDEIADLSVEINRMIRGLKERDLIRDTFGRYVSPEVAQQVLADPANLRPGGEVRTVTIMMSDLRGFTSLSERLSPAEMIELLNAYLGRMAELIHEHGGTVIEFIGDGIMSLFGAPFEHGDDALRAVRCAAAMQVELESFNAEIAGRVDVRLEMGIGINTGNVIVGNIGSESRMKYGVVGDDVNLAGRIESFTVGGEVLVSSSTRKVVGEIATFRGPIEVRAKGKHGSQNVWALVAYGDPPTLEVPAEHRAPEGLTPAAGQVQLRLIVGKEVADEALEATIDELGKDALVLTTAADVQRYDDVMLQVELEAPSRERFADLYAKVVKVEQQEDGRRCRLRFTSVPQPTRQRIKQLTEA